MITYNTCKMAEGLKMNRSLVKRSLTGKLRIEYKSLEDPRKELDGQTLNLTKDLDSARTILGGKESEITDLQRRSHTRHSEPAEITHPILFKMEISPATKSADSFCMAEGAGW